MKWFVLLFYNIILPPALLVLLPGQWRKMRRRGGYGRLWGERFGRYGDGVLARVGSGPTWWVHAVSVGEVLVAVKFIQALRESGAWAGPVGLTTTTSTGRALAEERADDRTTVVWTPLDLPWVAARALRALKPERIVLVEAEVWPNLLGRAAQAGVPVQVINARLSPRSEKRFKTFRTLVAPIFRLLDRVCVQDEGDARRYQALGVDPSRIAVTGSIKFDDGEGPDEAPGLEAVRAVCADSEALRGKRIVLAASTHPGEEARVARAWLALRPGFPDTALVAVPRHFERAPEAVRDLQSLGLAPCLRSLFRGGEVPAGDCLVVDTTGELRAWYEVAAVVIVGKSFPPHAGGQNPAEPVRAGKPTLTGPRMDNFSALMEVLVAADGIRPVASADALADAVRAMLADPGAGAAMAARGREALAVHRGATARTVRVLCGRIPGVPS